MTKVKIVIATVKGDIHDMWVKNIVAALLENNGYRVIDLGKDVDKEDIIKQRPKENNADNDRSLFAHDYYYHPD